MLFSKCVSQFTVSLSNYVEQNLMSMLQSRNSFSSCNPTVRGVHSAHTKYAIKALILQNEFITTNFTDF